MRAAAEPRPTTRAMERDEFARRLQPCARRLWTVAAAVLGDRWEAQDVLQEACVIALEKLGSFRSGAGFEPWMGRIVRFVALNRLRKHRPVPTEHEALERPGPTPVEPAPVVSAGGELDPDQHAFDDRVVAALQTLAPMARACLLLRTVEQLDYRTLATTLGIPEGTAMSHVHRARERLRELLTEDEAAEAGGTA